MRSITRAAAAATATIVVGAAASPPLTLRTTQRQLFTQRDALHDAMQLPPSLRVQSPLAHLRPPPPPSARDVLPFGCLNKTHRPRYYYNVNAVTARPHGGVGGNSSNNNVSSGSNGEAGAVAHPAACANMRHDSATAAASAMDVARLTRNNNGKPLPQHRCTTDSDDCRFRAHSSGSHRSDEHAPLSPHGGGGTHTAGSVATTVAPRLTCATAPSSPPLQSCCGGDDAAATVGHAQQQHRQVYEEHCVVGWSLHDFYSVVADVGSYSMFLPWCVTSHVHTHRCMTPTSAHHRSHQPPHIDSSNSSSSSSSSSSSETAAAVASGGSGGGGGGDGEGGDAAVAEEMTATLTVGFSWLTESYTSHVTLVPGKSIVAVLHDDDNDDGGGSRSINNNKNNSKCRDGNGDDVDSGNHLESSATSAPKNSGTLERTATSGGGLLSTLLRKAVHTASAVARKSILQHLCCEWQFAPRPGKPHEVEVRFTVSFTFTNPLYSRLIMSNIVTIMIKSFERRCEALYGPPSTPRRVLSP